MNHRILSRLTNEWRLDSIGVSIFAALTIVAYLLQFEPAMRDRDAVRLGSATLAEKRQVISKLQATIFTLNGHLKTLQSAQASEMKLLPASELNDRLSAFSSLAAEHGLQVEALEPGDPSASAKDYLTIPIRMNGHGNYPQFASFIRALREKLPDTSVTDINVSSGGSGAAATFTLNLLWYAAPAPTVAKNEMQ